MERRDILAGIVSSELAKNGYCGKIIYLYGVVVIENGHYVLYWSEDEAACVQNAIEKYEENLEIGPVISVNLSFEPDRINAEFDVEEQGKDKLWNKCKEKWQRHLDNVEKICVEFLKLEREPQNVWEDITKNYYAYIFFDQTWKYNINGNLLTIFLHWYEARSHSALVSDLYMKKFPINNGLSKSKAEFEKYMRAECMTYGERNISVDIYKNEGSDFVFNSIVSKKLFKEGDV
ncbi:MAG: hypothetical protein UEX93_08645 [Peptococcaceae bacterium]|nr:hypothetical protein [Peptococcaceae bacterium]